MSFPLKVEKTIQAIGVLFRADGVQRMNYMRLLKLLYIADREALKETARPITGGPMVAMERGPVLGEVYDLIRGQHAQMPLWDRFLRKERYDLELVNDPDVKKLSRYEIQKLQQIASRHAEDDEWALSRLTHEFEEWKKNDPGGSSRRISLDDVLAAVGLSNRVAEIAEDARHLALMERELGGGSDSPESRFRQASLDRSLRSEQKSAPGSSRQYDHLASRQGKHLRAEPG